jgi:hypothetical protein
VLVAVAAFLFGATPSILGTHSIGAKPSVDEYYRTVSDRMERLLTRGASQRDIDRALEREFGWVLVAGGSADDGRPAAENAAAHSNGRGPEPATDATAVTASSGPSSADCIEMRTPRVYRNTQQGRYEASAWFYWKIRNAYPCWMDDQSVLTADIGGYDGFGISISKLVSRRYVAMSIYTEDGARTALINPSDADDSGVTYRGQDRTTCGWNCGYNWDHGVVIYAFVLRSTCMPGEYQLNSRLGHTWASTSVSGISVSTRGISIDMSSTSNSWQAVNPVPLAWFRCGH